MTSMGAAVCGYCGAPLRELADGACPYCKTPVVLPSTAASTPTTLPPGVPAGIAVRLSDSGRNKINVIKVVREATGLGLKESKDLVERASTASPVVVLAGLSDEQSMQLLEDLRKAGATADRVQF